MNYTFIIALRYLFSKKKNNVINWITRIAISVVAIVAAALVVILSAMNGLSTSVMNLYSNFDPDLKVEIIKGNRFQIDSFPFEQIKALPEVELISQTIEETGLLKYQNNQEVATIKGVSNSFAPISGIENKIIEGYYGAEVGGANNTVLGVNIAYKLGVNTDANTPIFAYIPNLNSSGSGPDELFTAMPFYPRGIFNINNDFNSKYIIIALDKAQKLLGEFGKIDAVEIKLDSVCDPVLVKSKIETLLGNNFTVKTRFEQNEFLFKSINAEKWITILILSLIIVLAIFNVMGSLTMLIIDKKKDIFVLSSLGATKNQIRFIFWLEGSLISAFGTVIGLFLGVTMVLLQTKLCLFGYGTTSGFDCFPVEIQSNDLVLIALIINAIGSLASLIPIRKVLVK